MKNSNKLVGSTILIIVFSLIGKVLGFLRESFIAARFGANMEVDAFLLSQSAIALIASIITAAIATTFIPVLQKVERDLGEEKKQEFTNNMLAISIVASILFMLIALIFSRQVAFLFTFDYNYAGFDLITKLIKVSVPTILFSVMLGIFTGYLQYGGKFGIVGAIAIPLNLVNILYLIFFTKNLGIVGLTIASTVGVLAQLIFLLPSSFKLGYRPKFIFNIKDKYVIEALILSLPVFVSSSVDNINSIVNRAIALRMGHGAVSVLSFANKLNIMFIGIFITAITAVIFPIMSRSFGSDNIKRGKEVMNASIKIVLYLTIPAAVGMFILARPIIEITFLHGKFTVDNAIATTATLRCYTLSLISLSMISVLNRVYYALSDTKTPFFIGIINVVMNISMNILVAHRFGTKGLAASVSISTTITAMLLYILLKNKIGHLGTKKYIKALLKSLIAASIMALICLLYYELEKYVLGTLMMSKLIKLIVLLIIVVIAGISYIGMLYLLGVREVKDAVKLINKKRKSL